MVCLPVSFRCVSAEILFMYFLSSVWVFSLCHHGFARSLQGASPCAYATENLQICTLHARLNKWSKTMLNLF
ncbi:hypothetical protein F5878DRAFT_629617 [Lentinula raphanica]|uniref:Uncharacterized protein n=1 Tax=Lentinula raphanica TaxID=153919 RepID=A0AA38U9P0_9AGAR|nr:hypothetical protein F5878DRAFT_629617 [Lentinula raphanica]